MNQALVDPSKLFEGINKPPVKPVATAESAQKLEAKISNDVEQKKQRTNTALIVRGEQTTTEIQLAQQRVQAVAQRPDVFELEQVLGGWFTEGEYNKALAEIAKRRVVELNASTAADYGLPSDATVKAFVSSAATKATGEARLEVARVLDKAAGVTNQIAKDKGVSAEEVEKNARRILKVWNDVRIVDALFKQLFVKTLNRVVNYENRLEAVGRDLASKQSVLEKIESSLQARRVLVYNALYNTCISGLALGEILERETEELQQLEQERNSNPERGQALGEKIREQQFLVQIITKRLIDLKAYAIKLMGLYVVLGNTWGSVAVIKADVAFTRTNLMATLGLQLGLVVDIITVLRTSEAANNVREAEALASEKVGAATAVLNEKTTETLTNVTTTIRSLRATVEAARAGIQNTNDNMARVAQMTKEAESEFIEMFSQLSVAQA